MKDKNSFSLSLMTLRYGWIFLFFFLFGSTLHAQDKADVVYMTNGSFLMGKIVEVHPGVSVRFVVRNSQDTMLIAMSEIKEIRNETVPMQKEVSGHGDKERGWVFIPELNFGTGLASGLEASDGYFYEYAIGLSVVNGIAITKYVYLGLGIGFETWSTRVFVPFYLDLRVNWFRKVNTPFFYFDGGYAYSWLTNMGHSDYGGATAGLGCGGKFRVSPKTVMTLSLGYRYQQARDIQELHGVVTKGVFDANFVTFRAGLIF
jgi:hypothetical protein